MKRKRLFVVGLWLLVNTVSFAAVNAQTVMPSSVEVPLRADLVGAVKSVLQEHPELILEALEEKPVALADLIQRASIVQAVKAEENRRLSELKQPKIPTIDTARPIRGNLEAPITIVEYSDFECPFCRTAFSTVQQVLERYGETVRFVYKHNPLNFHPIAEPAARYFEAIAIQDVEVAWQFHDRVFEKQEQLTDGELTLQTIVASLDIDMTKLENDVNGEEVEDRLSLDRDEAERFGFDGTPAFLINGISMIGSQPKEDFEEIIQLVISKNLESSRVADSRNP